MWTSDGTPDWWKGDDDAARSALAAARAFGVNVAGVTAAAQAGTN